MSYFYTSGNFNDNSGTYFRQADGKVLGRVRMEVKGSTPQAGMKDYRFFVEPISSVPPSFADGLKYGFTGFFSRTGCGFNAFENEEEALQYLQNRWGDCFVTFTPGVRNNKFYVLDDIQKEGRTVYMDQDEDYRPIPAFGQVGNPVFGGDINKFCRHILTGKPIPGLSKKYWNGSFIPQAVIAYTDTYDGRLGDSILFAPLGDGDFSSEVISEGGAYFCTENNEKIGYKILHFSDDDIKNHVVRCMHSPLWFVPENELVKLRDGLTELPKDGDILGVFGIKQHEPIILGDPMYISRDLRQEALDSKNDVQSKNEEVEYKEVGNSEIDNNEIVNNEAENKESESKKTDNKELENQESEVDKEVFSENSFINGLMELAEAKGLLYHERDLLNFHISVKSARLTILSGLSGMGKSRLVRLYGEALGLSEEQVLMVPVRPSWMDDSDILGYADMKQMVYRPADTGLTELLLKAEKNPHNMYIVCFDEMNLARAEHYFAQFISVLEKEGTTCVRLYNPVLSGRLYNSDTYPSEIKVGQNVIFVGTVNVDESTYRFSDKILDRANVLTLHRERFVLWNFDEQKEILPEEEVSLEEWKSWREEGRPEFTKRELEFLDDLNRAFEKSCIQGGIGFRVARQIDAYLRNIPMGYDFDREEGWDCQMVQRVLTKLRGSAQQLDSLVRLSDKGEVDGSILRVLKEYADLSDFEESKEILLLKAQELKLYDYTI